MLLSFVSTLAAKLEENKCVNNILASFSNLVPFIRAEFDTGSPHPRTRAAPGGYPPEEAIGCYIHVTLLGRVSRETNKVWWGGAGANSQVDALPNPVRQQGARNGSREGFLVVSLPCISPSPFCRICAGDAQILKRSARWGGP